MKFVFVVLLLMVCTMYLSAQKSSDNFSGTWKTERGAVIKIIHSDEYFCAIVEKNNKPIIEGLRFANGKWNALLISPKDGSKHNCDMLRENDELKITVRKGIISKSFVCKKV